MRRVAALVFVGVALAGCAWVSADRRTRYECLRETTQAGAFSVGGDPSNVLVVLCTVTPEYAR